MKLGTRWKVVAVLKHPTDDSIAQPGREIVLASGEAASYGADLVDALVKKAASEGVEAIERLESDGGAIEGIEICIRPVLPDGSRPAFNLSAEAISALSKLNASLDFDPY